MKSFGRPPSNQMELELPGCGSEGDALMARARLWAGRHYEEFSWYKDLARRESECGKASPNFCLQSMRRQFRCEIPNAFAPCLARIAMEQEPGLRFRLARSRVDGFTTAEL